MSLRKKTGESKKSRPKKHSSKKVKEFRMRYPHRRGMWHSVRAASREEALEQFAAGTEYDKRSIVFEGEEFTGMNADQKARIMDLDRDGMEPRTIAMLEAKTDEEVTDVSNVSNRGWTGHEGWSIETDGNRDYMVFATEKDAEDYARELVKQDLEDQPEIFNQEWLQGHINEEKFFRDLKMDLDHWAHEDVSENPSGYDISEKDVEDQTPAFEQATEKYVEDYIEDIKQQGVAEWLKGLGSEDKIITYLDIDEAVDSAINTDGWAHFVSSYDGNYDYLLDGSVFWRVN
jgi:hypothetical protein